MPTVLSGRVTTWTKLLSSKRTESLLPLPPLSAVLPVVFTLPLSVQLSKARVLLHLLPVAMHGHSLFLSRVLLLASRDGGRDGSPDQARRGCSVRKAPPHWKTRTSPWSFRTSVQAASSSAANGHQVHQLGTIGRGSWLRVVHRRTRTSTG